MARWVAWAYVLYLLRFGVSAFRSIFIDTDALYWAGELLLLASLGALALAAVRFADQLSDSRSKE